jgi:hypothetical protein
MNTKRRRAGATETFSVSVDADTKRALRTLADAEFGGNLSALVTDFAEEEGSATSHVNVVSTRAAAEGLGEPHVNVVSTDSEEGF